MAAQGPIKLLIAFAAGGGADTQARLIAEEIEKRRGWKFQPVQVTGKGGAVMAAQLKSEPNDGTAIGFAANETWGYNMLSAKRPAYKASDFTYLTTTAGTQMGVVTRKASGFKSWKEVVAAAKSGKALKFGSMSPKLADGAYLLARHHGIKFNIVSLKGGKAVLNAITAGDVDLGWVAGIQAKGVKSGELLNLVSGEASRLKLSPDAPTTKELGVPFDFGAAFMVAGPAGMPPAARDAITKAIIEVVSDPKTKVNAILVRAFGGAMTIHGAALDQAIRDQVDATKALMAEASK
ncbi:MAG: tripartite tricarboxylate transporter substrate binding protein [Burkholderiaceae bacterium]